MFSTKWTQADTQRAQGIWANYAAHHDLSDRIGQTAGIDPVSGRIWFGQSAADIVKQMDAAAASVLLFFIRVGQDTYFRKGGRR